MNELYCRRSVLYCTCCPTTVPISDMFCAKTVCTSTVQHAKHACTVLYVLTWILTTPGPARFGRVPPHGVLHSTGRSFNILCDFTSSSQTLYCIRVRTPEAKYVESWPSTTSAWAGWNRFYIAVDKYGGVHSLLRWPSRTLGSLTCH